MASAAPPIPLRIDSVVKRYGDLAAVDGISLEVRERACLGLLGPNGAGKRVRTDSGSIRVFGHPAGSAAARAELGWVPQELALYPLLTSRENLEAFGRYQGLRSKPLRDATDWCLEWAALTDRAGATVKTLSGESLFDAFDGALGRARNIQCRHQSEPAAASAHRFAFGRQFTQPGQIAGVAALPHNQQRDQLCGRFAAPQQLARHR